MGTEKYCSSLLLKISSHLKWTHSKQLFSLYQYLFCLLHIIKTQYTSIYKNIVSKIVFSHPEHSVLDKKGPWSEAMSLWNQLMGATIYKVNALSIIRGEFIYTYPSDRRRKLLFHSSRGWETVRNKFHENSH